MRARGPDPPHLTHRPGRRHRRPFAFPGPDAPETICMSDTETVTPHPAAGAARGSGAWATASR